MKQVDEEHNDLYNQRREKSNEIKKLENALEQIEQRDSLLQEREDLKEKIKKIEPKGFLQRIRKVNENEIHALHRDLERIDNRILHEHKNTPNREAAPRIQKEMLSKENKILD